MYLIDVPQGICYLHSYLIMCNCLKWISKFIYWKSTSIWRFHKIGYLICQMPKTECNYFPFHASKCIVKLVSEGVIYSFNISLIQSLIQILIQSLIQSFIRPWIQSLIQSLIQPLIQSLIRSLMHSVIESVIESVSQWVSQSIFHLFSYSDHNFSS